MTDNPKTKTLTDFKPEFIKPYLSHVTLEYVCALEDEIERLREAQRWVPVTEKLPEIGETVLFRGIYSMFGQVFSLHYMGNYDGEGQWYSRGRRIGAVVANWMPLPALPEEGDE